jgi:hypothetical protein
MIMPDTKAINKAMTSFFFIKTKFDLQNNGFFPELLPYLQKFFGTTEN